MDSRTPLGLLLALLLALVSPVLGWVGAALALLTPGLLDPVYRAWQRHANQWAMQSYFALVLTPVAWAQRHWGHDPLQRQCQRQQKSYARAVATRASRHMLKPW